MRRIKLHEIMNEGPTSSWFEIAGKDAKESISVSTGPSAPASGQGGQSLRHSPFRTLKEERHRKSRISAELSRADVNNAPSPRRGIKSPVKPSDTPHHKSDFMLKFPHELDQQASRSVHHDFFVFTFPNSVPLKATKWSVLLCLCLYLYFCLCVCICYILRVVLKGGDSSEGSKYLTIDMLLSADESFNDRILRDELGNIEDNQRLQMERRLHPTQGTADAAGMTCNFTASVSFLRTHSSTLFLR